MTKKQHRLSLEPEIILQYLLNKCDFGSQRRLRLDYVFKFLGFVGLFHHSDLLEEYKKIHFDTWNALETLNAYKRLFTAAVQRGFPEKLKYPLVATETVNPVSCRYFLQSATEEGQGMLISADYQFLSIFLILCALGLSFDKAATSDFKDNCIGSKKGAAEIIAASLQIIAKALRTTEEDKTACN
jgi:hypothetical protein